MSRTHRALRPVGINKLFAHWLIEKDMTQRDLAKMLKTTLVLVSRVNSGFSAIPRDWLKTLPKDLALRILAYQIDYLEAIRAEREAEPDDDE